MIILKYICAGSKKPTFLIGYNVLLNSLPFLTRNIGRSFFSLFKGGFGRNHSFHTPRFIIPKHLIMIKLYDSMKMYKIIRNSFKSVKKYCVAQKIRPINLNP